MNKNNFGDSISDISTEALNYNLEESNIAKYPLSQRDQSKLLIYRNGKITDSKFLALSEFLPEHSLLIFNNTKVIRARLHFQKATGANIEVFCLDPTDPSDYQISFQQTSYCTWNCMVGNLKKWKNDILVKELNVNGKNIYFKAEKLLQREGAVQVKFSWDEPSIDFASIIEAAGILPIPPYLNRETENSDIERYQTVYSKIKGSVAAPTAGLHFTDAVFQKLKNKSIDCEELTLHVGAGTFKPVQSKTIADHDMHAEQIIVHRDLVEKILNHNGKLIAVGTTSIRTLESLYWLGTKLHTNPDVPYNRLGIEQWQPYNNEISLSKTAALEAILQYMTKHELETIAAHTKIIIVPGYQFRIIDGMITNFHQPQSTLLLLISAYLGNDWKWVYKHALDNNYRFLSYGDSNLYLND